MGSVFARFAMPQLRSTTLHTRVTPSPGEQNIRAHPLREELMLEVHARPFEPLTAPARGSHLAVMTETVDDAEVLAHLGQLCARYGAPIPPPGAKFYSQDLGPFRLRWEQHTEFATYTFIRMGAFKDPFADAVITLVPFDWLEGLPGHTLAAVHFALEPKDAPERDLEQLQLVFGGNAVVGAEVTGGAARAWSDLRSHNDGFSRILIRDQSLRTLQAGRLVQRLLEINAYRLLTLLSLPLAREVTPRIRKVEGDVVELTSRIADGPTGQEKDLLDKLSGLASEIEKIGAMTGSRFAGTRAYFDIVKARLGEIRQQRIQGIQTYSEFLERRMVPAVNFVNATAERLAALSERIERVAGLVRTRVEVQIEVQNRDLLASMDRRARLQFRLQRVVESLSVVAITYYVLGVFNYFLHGLVGLGLHFNEALVSGVAVPIIVVGVWLILHRARKYLRKDTEADG